MGDGGDAMKRGASHHETPFVSVIVPVRNECGFIGRALDSILTGDYPADRMEVIVADGMSTDGTRERVTEYSKRDPRVRMIDNPARITPIALNLAIDASLGEIIARVDAHATVARDYLSRSVHYLESTGADNVGGPMRTLPQSSGPFSGAIVAALSHRFGVGNSHFRVASAEAQPKARWVDTVFGGCWRREVFEQVGRFNEDLERSQDMEFSLRLKAAGGKTLLAPNVRSDYYARSDLRSFLRHNFVNGEWAVLPFLYSEIMPVSVRHLVPLIFVMTLALGAALARGATLFLAAALPRGATLSLATALPHGAALSLAAALLRSAAGSPWTVWPLAMVVIPYVVLNLAASTQVAWRERKPSFLATMPMVFVTLHVSYGLGSACGLLQVVSQVIREKLARRGIVSGSRSGRDKTTAREAHETSETSATPAADVAMVALKAMIAPNRIVAAEPVEEVACLPRN
jgi:cellulose synthase/poly-beta-1,6-N-acetylglucosamine synthase-like glycosyltransferase